MDPAVISGGVANIKSDIYSLGMTLYQWLSDGLFPSCGDGHTLITNIMEGNITQLKDVACVPDALNQCVMKMISRDPAQRLGSAHEVIRIMSDILETHAQTEIG